MKQSNLEISSYTAQEFFYQLASYLSENVTLRAKTIESLKRSLRKFNFFWKKRGGIQSSIKNDTSR